MSRNMQMRVRILPYYKQGFKKVYPKIAHELRHVEGLFDSDDPSLFQLVAKFDTILYELQNNAPVKEVFKKQRKKLTALYEEIEERIADWQLSKVDLALYAMEDVFDEIERELGKL